MYDLGYMLHSPFGSRKIDIPHELYYENIAVLTSYYNSIQTPLDADCINKNN